jgi:outer membrane lipoprotein SlyB
MSTKSEDFAFWKSQPREVVCPRCQKTMQLTCKWRQRGAVAGAIGGAAMAYSGARAGASIGSCFLPGLGTLVGMATGALVGGLTGAKVGEAVDRDLIASYKCQACGCTCRLND